MKSCAVAHTKQTQRATSIKKDATMNATATQLTSLKALSARVLHRNEERNTYATPSEKQRNFLDKKDPQKLRSVADIQKMPLSDFENSGLTLKIWSEVLQEHIYFVSSDAVLNQCSPLDAVAYTAMELTTVLDMESEEVRAIHEVKRVFQKGRVVEHIKALKRNMDAC